VLEFEQLGAFNYLTITLLYRGPGMTTVAPISQQIWDMKYRLKGPDGAVLDATIEDTWLRVAAALSQAEEDPATWTTRFNEALDDFKFLPAGRIIAGSGTGRDVTLFNCFVMGTVPDDMAGIFENLKEAALTMQQGGGIGYDFSTIRPKGARVKGVGADASGPLTFMDVWDSMCRTIMSAGHRRGAMMATLRCDHPDLEAFIAAKRDAGRLRMFNLSVLVTDAFMAAVKDDLPWDLVFGGTVYESVRARELWDSIMQATYAFAEPGVIFIDRINRRNNLYYAETICATNPCGEQPLPPYGACLLGSVNLTKLVTDPFEADAELDIAALEKLVTTAVRMLDNAIDVSKFPLPEQQNEAKAKRRIGLGITGLADALIMCGVRYGSTAAVNLTEKWMRAFSQAAYRASVELAREKGPFPLFDAEKYLAGESIQELDEDIRSAIAEHGIRNALLTSVAPTGTISLFADNISSGLEPVFSFNYSRNVLLPDGTRKEEQVSDYAWRLYRQMKGENRQLTDAFVGSQDLTPDDHVRMQAVVQKYIDSAVSKTINVPEDIDFDAFKDVYINAYESGCKGLTTYRPNDITGSVLQVTETKPAVNAEPELPLNKPQPKPRDNLDAGGVVYMTKPLDRPEVLPGQTYKVRWPESDHAIYITVNDVINDGRRRPFEVFINSKNTEHYAWTVGLTRMISAVFRRGGDVSFVVEELKAVFDPRGGHWMNGRYVPSLLAAIGEIIEEHLIGIGFMAGPDVDDDFDAQKKVVNLGGHEDQPSAASPFKYCPRCSQPSLMKSEGCDTCTSCGYSKCG
jgi:ribonucleoside-diphosphate reductase alpha chain